MAGIGTDIIYVAIIACLVLVILFVSFRKRSYEVDLSSVTDDMPLDALDMIDTVSSQKKEVELVEPEIIVTKHGEKLELGELERNLERLYKLREKLIKKHDSGSISNLIYKNLLKRYADKILTLEKLIESSEKLE